MKKNHIIIMAWKHNVIFMCTHLNDIESSLVKPVLKEATCTVVTLSLFKLVHCTSLHEYS